MTLVRFSKYYFVSDVGLNQFSKHCFVPGQRPSIKYVVTELAILDPLPPSQLSFCRSFCSEHCLMPGQVRFEQEGQYIDNLQDRKLGSATSVWGQVQVYKGAVNTVCCQVRLGFNRQDSISILYKKESLAQRMVFRVRFRSKQIQPTLFGVRLVQI